MTLAAPALWTGWQQDDLIHRYFLLGNVDYAGERPSPLDLFYFLNGDTARAKGLTDIGVVPWWTLPELRLSFLRPLTSFTHWIDYQLWPQNGVMMHLHSLFWFGAVVVVASSFYRRMLGWTWVAGLAAILFALDDAHGLPAGWLANRNALLSLFFGLLVLLVHDRWRQESWRPGAYLGPLLLLSGLLSGESALAVGGYLLSYAVIIDPGSARGRVWSLVPYAVVSVAWLILYKVLGYGTHGSGFYVDALSEPMQFLSAVLWKAPLLLADQWGLPPSSIIVFLDSDAITLILIWSLLLIAALGVILFPLARRDRLARFWLTGMLLSIPLVCTTMPHSRLLSFVGIGGMGLLAQWVGGILSRAGWMSPRGSWRVLARGMLAFFLVVHLLVAPILLAMNATSAAFAEPYIQEPMEDVVLGPSIAQQDLVIVNHPLAFYAHYFLTVRMLSHQSIPRSVRVLAPGARNLSVRRLDASTLSLRPAGGFLESPFDRVFRGLDHPLLVGDEVQLNRMSVMIMRRAADGRPSEAVFRFGVSLEDSSLSWLQWQGDRFVPFQPPLVGDSVILRGWPLDLSSP